MEDEWEESYVYVELTGVPEGQLCPPETGNVQAQVLGLASERPALQMGGHRFAGQYEDALGTNLFFETKGKQDGGSSRKSHSVPVASTEFVCKTDKKLVMQPVIFLEKTPADTQAKEIHQKDSSVSEEQELRETSTVVQTSAQDQEPT